MRATLSARAPKLRTKINKERCVQIHSAALGSEHELVGNNHLFSLSTEQPTAAQFVHLTMNTGSRLPFISTRRAGVTIGHIFPSPSLLRAGVTIGQTRHPPRSFWLVLTSTQQQQVCIDVNRALQKTDRQKENHGRVLCRVVL